MKLFGGTVSFLYFIYSILVYFIMSARNYVVLIITSGWHTRIFRVRVRVIQRCKRLGSLGFLRIARRIVCHILVYITLRLLRIACSDALAVDRCIFYPPTLLPYTSFLFPCFYVHLALAAFGSISGSYKLEHIP